MEKQLVRMDSMVSINDFYKAYINDEWQSTEWEEYDAVYSKDKNVNGPKEYKYVKVMPKSAWEKSKHSERMSMLGSANVLVVNDETHWKAPMEKLSKDEMHSFVDVFEVRYCHGK